MNNQLVTPLKELPKYQDYFYSGSKLCTPRKMCYVFREKMCYVLRGICDVYSEFTVKVAIVLNGEPVKVETFQNFVFKHCFRLLAHILS